MGQNRRRRRSRQEGVPLDHALLWFRSVRRVARLAAILGAPVLATACFPPRAPVDLRKVRVVGISVAPESASAICPGQDVTLTIDVDAIRDGQSAPTRLHVRRNVLEDWIYPSQHIEMSSAQGAIDEDGIFHASANPRLSAAGFMLNLRPPNGGVLSVRLPPSYACVRAVGFGG